MPLTQTAKSSTYQSYALHNFKGIPQISKLSDEQRKDIEIVSQVLPFKSNNYVVDELINWNRVPDDPIFTLTFPRREMLTDTHYAMMKQAMDTGCSKDEIKKVANSIRKELNPHPAGQLEHNVPMIENHKLTGMQHKYRETVLFFQVRDKPVMPIAVFVFAGHSL
jgi:L-lysine 2,3-aminomutase